jgi:bifunctional non-homologous end joining protein LigD
VPPRGVVYFGDHVLEHGADFLAAACEQGLEGVVAKKRDSLYAAQRSRDWLKIKCQLRQEFVIGGYTAPQGTRAHFGALHLGLYDRGELVYVSKVGTGFDVRTLKDISGKLRRLERPTSPFVRGTPAGRDHHWVEPRLVCEVRFTEWTADGGLRHPIFMGLRTDRKPEEIQREAAQAAAWVGGETAVGELGHRARHARGWRGRTRRPPARHPAPPPPPTHAVTSTVARHV